ncbi:MAG TPA: TetR family transcriptional regulator [Solirubrobacteraceae bacterium]|nr:TetR family transcriptional regulator [Solirubrobacteraceae bacterium]
MVLHNRIDSTDETAAAVPPRPGVHDPEGRRRAVLAAARRLFAARGYEQTSIRAIAAAARVNQGLIMSYFGSKEGLFMEVVGRVDISRSALEGDVDGMGARLAHLYVERWENMAADDPWAALVRSALSHRPSAELLRSALDEQYAPLRAALGESPESEVRITIVRCLLGGMIMERYLPAGAPSRAIPVAAFEAALAAALQHALTGPLPRAASA